MTITTTQLLQKVKSGVTVPANQARFTDEDLLGFGDDETESRIVPIITSIRQEFFVKKKSVPVVANQAAYKFPYRAVGRTLRNLYLRSTTQSTVIKELPFVMLEDKNRYLANSGGDPQAYTVMGDYIIILPTPVLANYYIDMEYELAPSKYVSTSRTQAISSFDLTTGIISLSATNSTFLTGQEMDIVDGRSGNSVKVEDITNTNVSGADVTFLAANLPAATDMGAIAVGDILCLSNETSVLQIPNECSQLLVQCIIGRILEALGDFKGLEKNEEKLTKVIIPAAQDAMNPRVESKAPVVVNRNGLLRGRNAVRWRINS